MLVIQVFYFHAPSGQGAESYDSFLVKDHQVQRLVERIRFGPSTEQLDGAVQLCLVEIQVLPANLWLRWSPRGRYGRRRLSGRHCHSCSVSNNPIFCTENTDSTA
jgi:hypothetical protein